jgi:hypothetical protein
MELEDIGKVEVKFLLVTNNLVADRILPTPWVNIDIIPKMVVPIIPAIKYKNYDIEEVIRDLIRFESDHIRIFSILSLFTEARLDFIAKYRDKMNEDRQMWLHFIKKVSEDESLNNKVGCSFTFMQDAFEDKDFPLKQAIADQFNAAYDYFYNKAKELIE